MCSFGWRQAVVSSYGPGPRGGGGYGTERCQCQSQRVSASSSPCGFQFIRQDEFSQFGSSRVTLGGDVHVRGVSSQQPGTLQTEGDALSAAVHLQTTQKVKDTSDTYISQAD